MRYRVFGLFRPVLLVLLLGIGTNAVAAGTLTVGNSYAVGTTPAALAAGDFNHDGRLDIAVVNYGSADVSILLGKGDGTFRTSMSYPACPAANSIAVADFNNDGRLDLAVAGSNGDVTVLLGNGDGTFQPPLNQGLGTTILAMAVGDFNGDHQADLVVGTSAGVGILAGHGDGYFGSLRIIYGQAVWTVKVADFNRDSNLDVALSGVGILLGAGDGSFQLVTTPITLRGSFVVADFNHDDIPDIFFLEPSKYGFGVAFARTYLGHGDATFDLVTGASFLAQSADAVADFDGDGRLDIALRQVASPPGPSITVLQNTGGGAFSTQPALNLPFQASALVAGDFNNDGSPDIVVANVRANTVTVLLNEASKPASLVSIVVTPPSFSISAGATLQFQATGVYSDAATRDVTGQVGWSSTNTVVATINATGLAEGKAAGSTVITAAVGSTSGIATLTVTTAPPPPPPPLPPPPPPTSAFSLFPNTAIPAVLNANAGAPIELGMRFKADRDGYVLGIRFYKATANDGTHTGTLWDDSTKQPLAQAVFTAETASGWQQANFSSPMRVAANTVYVASYHSWGPYSCDFGYFNARVDNPPLHAIPNPDEGNGVYWYGSTSMFPATGAAGLNFWVDVVFQ